MSPDDDLMTAAAAGVPGALDTLAQRHRPGLLSWFRGRGLQEHDAEDCVQDTFIRLHQALGRYEAVGRFHGFLRLLARNAWVDWTRRKRPDSQPLQSAAQLSCPALTAPDERLDLGVAWARLPKKHRDVLELTVRSGLTYREAALQLGIPEGTVKSRVYHAVRRLRKDLDHDA
ncbi:MAG: RNA polymerase sigma-70 factor (ECF subfamily) [Pseudohongiellaceae bacterium]|jgi:RNA polymerase sigma-70 factor (ECF subfamily)